MMALKMLNLAATIRAIRGLALAPLLCGAAVAQPSSSLLPPVGMLLFCQGHANQCTADGTVVVPLTARLLAMLKGVNTRVNGAIVPHNDIGRDVWSVDVRQGDCEDYVLTKRALLIRGGVAAGALRIATTRTPAGEQHAILVVKTSSGDLVLDNLRPEIRSLHSSGYRLRMISTANPWVWSTQ